MTLVLVAMLNVMWIVECFRIVATKYIYHRCDIETWTFPWRRLRRKQNIWSVMFCRTQHCSKWLIISNARNYAYWHCLVAVSRLSPSLLHTPKGNAFVLRSVAATISYINRVCIIIILHQCGRLWEGPLHDDAFLPVVHVAPPSDNKPNGNLTTVTWFCTFEKPYYRCYYNTRASYVIAWNASVSGHCRSRRHIISWLRALCAPTTAQTMS